MPKEEITFARRLRREQTPFERTHWKLLRDNQFDGFHFRRQHPIGPYIADFACFKARLIVELDGNSHDERIEKDVARDAALAKLGWRVLRFPNIYLRDHPEEVWRTIELELGKGQEGQE